MAKYSAFAASADARYSHISPEQKAEVAAACASAQEWMEERRGEADALAPTVDPPFRAAEVAARW